MGGRKGGRRQRSGLDIGVASKAILLVEGEDISRSAKHDKLLRVHTVIVNRRCTRVWAGVGADPEREMRDPPGVPVCSAFLAGQAMNCYRIDYTLLIFYKRQVVRDL